MKIVRYVVIFMLLSVYGYDISWAAFKDVTSETNEAAEEFSSEGMLGSFIYQFGQDMFRPDGYVTRESFILVLKEYHMLTKTILNQNKSFS